VFNVKKRIQAVQVNNKDMSIQEILEPGKVKILVLDGIKGTASCFEAVTHGETIVETVAGTTKRIHFRESELF
jgi:hypothetical protein